MGKKEGDSARPSMSDTYVASAFPSSVILIPLPLLVLLLALLIHLISCHNGYSINDSHLGEGGKSNEAEQKLKMAKY